MKKSMKRVPFALALICVLILASLIGVIVGVNRTAPSSEKEINGENIAHKQIADIQEIVDVKDVSEVPADEMKNPDLFPSADAAAEEEPDADPVDSLPEEMVINTSEELSGWKQIDGNLYYYNAMGKAVTGLKKIDGRIYYFNEHGVKASSVGVDVSTFNKSVDWQALKDQGIDFAIIRVGGRTWKKGDLYGDSSTDEYLSGAKDAGLKVGVYFYSTAISEMEAVQEASVVLSEIDGVSLDMPVFLDIEFSGIYPKGRSDHLSVEERTKIAQAFCETIENSGYSAGIYSNAHFLSDNLDFDSLSQYQIWLANYTTYNKLPSFTKDYDIWQFTNRGRLDGVTGYVDLNVIF